MPLILIADDDASNRSLVSFVLTHAGYEVVEARDAAETFVRLRERPPDLVLLDLSLPDMSGVEVLRRLRRDVSLRAISVALYTATPIDASLREFMGVYGISHAIAKPSEPQELQNAVEAALRCS